MERQKEKDKMRGCRHSRRTAISPGLSWCVKCGAYRMTRLVPSVAGWRTVWGKWNKPAGA
jgi:hypothetical protein